MPDELWEDDDADYEWDYVLLADNVGVAALDRKSDKTWLLDILDVRPAGRGKGLGPELIRAAAEYVQSKARRRSRSRCSSRTPRRSGSTTGAASRRSSGRSRLRRRARLRRGGDPDDRRRPRPERRLEKVRRDAAKVLRREPELAAGDGWTRVEAKPDELRNLARELSFTTGVSVALTLEAGAVVRYVLFDRGSMVDEYLSVPEYFGELPPGDVMALGANPTVVARLTNADPGRVAQSRAPRPRRRICRLRRSCTSRSPRSWESSRDAHALRRAALPVLRARADRPRRKGRRGRRRRDRPLRPPAWLYEKNPAGRVPVLEEDDRPLPESAVIMEFLEERYPEPALLPADPADRAFVRLQIFRDDELTDPYYAFRRGEGFDGFDAALRRFDAALTEHPFLGGAEFGLADIAFVPWILRARDMLGVDFEPYPALAGWLERVLERPAVAAEAGIVAAL